MACGGNNSQQGNIQAGTQTADGSPPMSLVGGGTNAIPVQAQAPLAPQQMAQQAAAMPTAPTQPPVGTNGQPVTDGMMPDGSYNPKFDSTINQMAGRMKYMQQSGAFNTPYQNAMKNHPVIMGLANAAQAFGQGLTKQPFYTENQANQASLQNTQEQNAASLMSPNNILNSMFLKQMMGQNTGTPAPVTGNGYMSGTKGRVPLPEEIAAAKKAGATQYNDQTGEWLAPVKIGQ